jgi:hypothetical protein
MNAIIQRATGRVLPVLLGLTSLAAAQVGPGLPQITYTNAELYKPVATLKMPAPFGHNLVSMHKGYLLVAFAPDHMNPGGGLRFYDMSNPRNPVAVSTLNNTQTQQFVEAHGYGASSSYPGDYAVFQSRTGIMFWNLTDVMNPKLIKDMALPGINGGGYDNGVFCVFWQAPYVYTASSAHGIHVVDAKDPANPKLIKQIPISQTGNFRVGLVFAVGNLLMVSAVGLDNNSHGYAFFDISNPESPQALSIPTGLPNIYASLLNGNKVYGTGLDGKLHVHDITDPKNVKLAASSAKLSDATGEYIYVQDHFAMAAFQTEVHKVDLRNMQTVGSPMRSLGEAQEGHPTPLGNILVVGDDHSVGSGVIPHSAMPDRTGPAVNMVHPPANAVNQALTTRVGITLTDLIDLQSVGQTTFTVREVGGQALPGKYSGQMQILNFSPDQPLKSGTTYEVVIPQGGIKDVSGNATAEVFISRFTTKGMPSSVTPRIPHAAFVGTERGEQAWTAQGRLLPERSGRPAAPWSALARKLLSRPSAGTGK